MKFINVGELVPQYHTYNYVVHEFWNIASYREAEKGEEGQSLKTFNNYIVRHSLYVCVFVNSIR